MFGVRIFAGLLVISICFGCGKGSKKNDEGEPLSAKIIEGQTGKNLYARGFSILPTNRGWELTLMDPWNIGEVFAKYDISADSPAFNRWAVSSTTHIGFLDALGETDKIVGCTSPDRIYNKDLVARYEAGDLNRIGSDMELNLESVLGLEPDIILQTAFEGQKVKDQRFRSTGLDFIYIIEWMEPHPLGRAEWIKVFGLLTGKMEKADSIFRQVSDQYIQLKTSVADMDQKPLVMIGNNFNGTWYMPGGQNFMCRFLEDAGYYYPFMDSQNRGSLALNFENVLEKFREADIWLGVSARDLRDLDLADSRYSLFDPFHNHNVFSLNGRVNAQMGNDYWESGVLYPNLILADLISIAYPEILPGHSLRYYKKLNYGDR